MMLFSVQHHLADLSAPHAAAQTCANHNYTAVITLHCYAFCTRGTIKKYYKYFKEPNDNPELIQQRSNWNLFPKGFANVGVVFTDVTCYQNPIVRQGKCHA